MPGESVGSAYATIGFKVDESGLNSAKSKMTSAVNEMEGKAGRLGSAVGGAMVTAGTAGAVALAGIATVGVKSYMDIESAAADAASKMDLSAIAQASGQTTEQAFDSVKEHVMALSDELGQLNTNAFDPTQIAGALANLASGGFDVATASAADLSPILSLATATNYDLGASASMVMSTMNQYGMSISDISNISDVFTTACGASALGMEDLNVAMSYAGPAAAAAGVSFNDTVAALEVFSQSGIKGEKAGTALVDVFNTLINPVGSAAKAFETYGISLDEVDPRTHSFSEVLSTLKEKADASGDGLKAFTEIFGVRGGLIYGLASSTDALDTFKSQLDNCDGAADRMGKNMLNTLKGSFDAASGAASSLAYLVGSKLAPSLRSALDWFSSEGAPAIREFINAVADGDWSSVGDMISKGIRWGIDKLKDLGSTVLGWFKSIDWGAVGAYVAGGIENALGALGDLGSQLVDAIGVDKIKAAISGLVTGAGFAALGVGMLAIVPIAASMAAGVIGAVASMAVGAATRIASMVAVHVAGFATMLATAVSSWASQTASAIVAWAAQKAEAVAGMAAMVASTLAGYAAMTTGTVSSVLGMAAIVAGGFATMASAAAARMVTMSATAVSSWASQTAAAVAGMAAMVASTLTGYAAMTTGAVSSVLGMAARVAGGFATMASAAAARMATMSVSVLAGYASMASGALVSVATMVTGTVSAITGMVATIVGTVASLAAPLALIAAGLAAIGLAADPGKFTTLKTIATDAFNGIKDVVLDCWESIKAGDFAAVGERLKQGLSDAYEYIKNIDWAAVATDMTSAIKSGWETLSNLGSQLLDWLQEVNWGGVASTIVSAIRTGWNALVDLGKQLWTWISEVEWGELADSIAGKLKTAWTTITDWAGPIVNGIIDSFTSWVEGNGAYDLGMKMATYLANGFSEFGKWIYDKIKTYWTTNGSSLGGVIRGAINFVNIAIQAAVDFATGFGTALYNAGKGTIGVALYRTIADALQDVEIFGEKVFEGLAESLNKTADEWETAWKATADDVLGEIDGSTVNVDAEMTITGENPLELFDGKTVTIGISFNYAGEDWRVARNDRGDGDIDYTLDRQLENDDWESGDVFDTPQEALETILTRLAKATESTATATENMASASESTAETTDSMASAAKDLNAATSNAKSQFDIQTEKTLEFANTMDAMGDEYLNKAKATTDEITTLQTETASTVADTTGEGADEFAETTTKAATDSATTTKTGATDSATTIKNAIKDSYNIWKKGIEDTTKSFKDAVQTTTTNLLTSGQKIADAANKAASDMRAAGVSLSSSVANSAASIQKAGSSCGAEVQKGGSAAAAALIAAASTIKAAVSNLGIPAHASGTKTTGPEVALIGEAGTEYVIPADSSRPDLMSQAMSDYGIGIPDSALAAVASSKYSNVTGVTVVAAGKGEQQSSGVFAALEKAAAMVAEATRYLAQTADVLSGAVSSMANATSTWSSTVTSTTEETCAIIVETTQTNSELSLDTANQIKEIQMESTDNIKTVVDDLAEYIRATLSDGADIIVKGAQQTADALYSAGETVLVYFKRGGEEFTGTLKVTAMELDKAFIEITKRFSIHCSEAALNISRGGSSASNFIMGGGAKAGASLARGGAEAAQSIVSAANTLAGVVSSLASNGHAAGVKTTGPEFALIGESGTEYVIPTTTKRWDLLYGVMKEYGLRVPKAARGGIFNQSALGKLDRTASESRIVLEDHTVHELYIDGKKVTDIFMKTAQHKIKARQGALSNW